MEYDHSKCFACGRGTQNAYIVNKKPYCGHCKPDQSAGAIRAAEIITGGQYGSKQFYATTYGEKTVKGIADLIDRQTAAPELLQALQDLMAVIDNLTTKERLASGLYSIHAYTVAQAVIKKAIEGDE